MPVYTYKCEDCKKIFDIRHGMFFEEQKCIECYSEFVFRLPVVEYTNTAKSARPEKKVGSIVNKYIKDF